MENVDVAQTQDEESKDHNPCGLLNVGYGSDVTIKELAETVAKVIGYEGEIIWDSSKPDGTPRKMMDSSKMRELGWTPKVHLEEGIKLSYEWYLK